MKTSDQLLERALVLIMDEWGHSRERALEWLNDDTEDWTPRPQSEPSYLPGTFIQVTRTTNFKAGAVAPNPNLAGLLFPQL